jgi:hypothetical protein
MPVTLPASVMCSTLLMSGGSLILNKDHAGRHAEAVGAFPADCGGTTRSMNPAERESPGLL